MTCKIDDAYNQIVLALEQVQFGLDMLRAEIADLDGDSPERDVAHALPRLCFIQASLERHETAARKASEDLHSAALDLERNATKDKPTAPPAS